jgi:DNA primase
MQTKNARIDIEKVKRVAILNIESLFRKIGITEYEKKFDCLTGACPIHNGDNRTAFCFNLSKEIWSCFTNECHKRHGNDIIGLVMSMKECSFIEAADFISECFGVDCKGEEISEEDYLSSFKPQKKETTKKTYDESILSRLDQNNQYLIDRGIKKDTVEKFKCGVAKTGVFKNRLVFPIFDKIGHIVGFTGRILGEKCTKCGLYHTKEDGCKKGVSAKWLDSYGYSKGEILYNLNNAKKYIKSSGNVIIVEGIIDVMKLYEAGIKNVVGLLGLTFNTKRLYLLMSIGKINNVFLCTDDDDRGMQFKSKHSAAKDENFQLLGRYFNVKAVQFNGAKDFGDMSVEEIKKIGEENGF